MRDTHDTAMPVNAAYGTQALELVQHSIRHKKVNTDASQSKDNFAGGKYSCTSGALVPRTALN